MIIILLMLLTIAMSTPVHSIQEVDALGTKRRYHNKQSLCYIIRSGVAGGVAGCVVCVFFFFLIMKEM